MVGQMSGRRRARNRDSGRAHRAGAAARVADSTRLRDSLLALVFGGVVIAVLGLIASFSDAPLIFPSLGPTAFLIFHRPAASAASPRNTVIGHLIGAACGLAALALFGLIDEPSAFEAGVTVERALAAGLSLGMTAGLMVWCRRGHPPSGATTLIVSLGLMTGAFQLLSLMFAVVMLIVLAQLLHRLAGTAYPLWAPAVEG